MAHLHLKNNTHVIYTLLSVCMSNNDVTDLTSKDKVPKNNLIDTVFIKLIVHFNI